MPILRFFLVDPFRKIFAECAKSRVATVNAVTPDRRSETISVGNLAAEHLGPSRMPVNAPERFVPLRFIAQWENFFWLEIWDIHATSLWVRIGEMLQECFVIRQCPSNRFDWDGFAKWRQLDCFVRGKCRWFSDSVFDALNVAIAEFVYV
jgi:hypothetical protein